MAQTRRLTKGLYGSEFDRSGAELFGLRCGQMGGDGVAHNGGWYNRQGEKLGWGDLNTGNVRRIMAELQEGELFIVLGEQDSFWHFVRRNPGPIGAFAETEPTEAAPGVDYVAEKCRYIVAPGKLYAADRYGYAERRNETHTEIGRGLVAEWIQPGAVKALLTGG